MAQYDAAMVDFLCIGAQKAGTTWLWENLRTHDHIAFPGGKEVHFWDAHYARGVDSYKKIFTPRDGLLLGDITPAYAILPLERIREIHQYYPEAKIIYIVRNPIERAWSAARMAVWKSDMRYEEVSENWLLEHINSGGSLARGDYVTCMDHWLSFYPEEQFLLLKTEDIATDAASVMKEVCHFLRVDPAPVLANPALKKKIFSGKPYPMPKAVKARTKALYADRIHALKEKYGIDYTDILAED